uniref:Uncharacterized protein n=1 Tax=Mycena chlorophos TaxID=658473 RepID=A0ABQ0L6E1_MYCCL|nr:predicted protein [Mycena chlorophos]
MGRRAVYSTDEERRAAVLNSHRKYNASERGQKVWAKYYQKKHGRKQPKVVIDAPPLLQTIIDDASFPLPFESLSFRRVLDGSSRPPRIYTFPPPYRGQRSQRLCGNLSELEASLHAHLLLAEREMDTAVRDFVKKHSAATASRRFTKDATTLAGMWEDLVRAELESEDDDEITKAMFVLYRRWTARHLVRLHSLGALKDCHD